LTIKRGNLQFVACSFAAHAGQFSATLQIEVTVSQSD